MATVREMQTRQISCKVVLDDARNPWTVVIRRIGQELATSTLSNQFLHPGLAQLLVLPLRLLFLLPRRQTTCVLEAVLEVLLAGVLHELLHGVSSRFH